MSDFKNRLKQALKSSGKVKYKKGGYKYNQGGYIHNAGGGDQVVYGATHNQGGVMRGPNVELEGGGFDMQGNPKAGEVITTIYDDGGIPREFYMSHKNGIAQKYLTAKDAQGGVLTQAQKQQFAKLNESMNPGGSPDQIAGYGGMKKYFMGGVGRPSVGNMPAENMHAARAGSQAVSPTMSTQDESMNVLDQYRALKGTYGGYAPEEYSNGGPSYVIEGLPTNDPRANFKPVDQGVHKQTVSQPWYSKTWDVITNPFEAASQYHRTGYLPDYFVNSPEKYAAGFDMAGSIINPAAWADAIHSVGSDISQEGLTTENAINAAFMAAFRKKFPKSSVKQAQDAWNKNKGQIINLTKNKSGQYIMPKSSSANIPVTTTRAVTKQGPRGVATNTQIPGADFSSLPPTIYQGPKFPWSDLGKATAAGTGLYLLSDSDDQTDPVLGNLEGGGGGGEMVDLNNNGVPDYLERGDGNITTDPTSDGTDKNIKTDKSDPTGGGGGGAVIDPDVQNQQNMLLERGYKLPKYGADGIMGKETENALGLMDKDKSAAAAGYGVDANDLEWDPTLTDVNAFGTDKGGWRPKEGAKNTEWGDTWDAEAGEWRDDAAEVYYGPEGNVISKEEYDKLGAVADKVEDSGDGEGEGSNFLDRIGLNQITDAIEALSILKANRFAQKQNQKIGDLKVKSQKVRPKVYSPELVDMNQEKADAQTIGTAIAKQAMESGKSVAEVRALMQGTQDTIRKIGLTEEQEQLKQRNFAKKMNISSDLQAQQINVSNDRQDQIANNDAMASMFKNSIALSQNMRDAISTKIKDTKQLKAAENEMLVINAAIGGGTGTDLRKGIPMIRTMMNKGTINSTTGNALIENMKKMYKLETGEDYQDSEDGETRDANAEWDPMYGPPPGFVYDPKTETFKKE